MIAALTPSAAVYAQRKSGSGSTSSPARSSATVQSSNTARPPRASVGSSRPSSGRGTRALNKVNGNTAAVRRGNKAHRQFADAIKRRSSRNRNGKRWLSEVRVSDSHTRKSYRIDAVTPEGRPVELKPNSPSGIRRGKRQIRVYQELLGKKGRVVYYPANSRKSTVSRRNSTRKQTQIRRRMRERRAMSSRMRRRW
ncbi:MAG: hypothetical protein LC778_20715 [Acidobacteria bacterium]|nr:hypothetical protein [Acidobacteriota bacterium]